MDKDQKRLQEIEIAWAKHKGEIYVPSVRIDKKCLIEKLSSEQNHRCCFCGTRTNEAKTKKELATKEHIFPRALGGPDDYENLAMACYECNQGKGRLLDYALNSTRDFFQRKERERIKHALRHAKREDIETC